MQEKLKKFEQSLIQFSDKHQLLRRGIYVGFVINGFLLYRQMVKFAALKRIQEYMVTKTKEFEDRIVSEQEQIMNSFKQ